MAINNTEYYERRVRKELAKAEAATNLEVWHVHQTMARLYQIRLDADKLAA